MHFAKEKSLLFGQTLKKKEAAPKRGQAKRRGEVRGHELSVEKTAGGRGGKFPKKRKDP